MAARPNILLFVTDDHGQWALPCYGNSEIQAPAFDRLAAEGARFDHHFTPCPVSSPARACILTGRTPSQVGIHDWLNENQPGIRDIDWLRDEITLGQLLREVGYRCGQSGKTHLGASHLPKPGFDDWFGMLHGQHNHHGKCTFGDNGQLKDYEGNRERIVTDHAINFITRAAAGGSTAAPWFLHVGYTATHSPYHTQDPAYLARYEHATFRDIPAYSPHPWHRAEGLHGHRTEPAHLRQFYRGYYAAVTNIDDGIGRLLTHLDQTGQRDNTLVIYVSDHGCSLGHQGFWGKGNSTRPLNMYETSIRVPMLMRWPGRVPAGSVVDRCTDHYDLFQALCEAAAVDLTQPPPRDRQYPGRSLMPLATGRAPADWDDTRIGEYGDLRMARTPRCKLVWRYPNGPHELFDLQRDPDEKHNLTPRCETDPELARTFNTLKRQIDDFYAACEDAEKSGLRVKQLPRFNGQAEAWFDGEREKRGLQIY